MAAPGSGIPPGVHTIHHHHNMVVPSMHPVSHAPHRVVSAPPVVPTALPPNRVIPPNAAPQDPNLRGRIIEVLSATANGCITELGYWPGMPKRLQELERINREWQTENVKLYQDNQSLIQTLQAQKEQAQLLSAPEAERLSKIRQLEATIQQLNHEKRDLIHRNETLAASLANATQGTHDQQMVPVSDYNVLVGKYRNVAAENQHLRTQLARSGFGHTPQPSPTIPQQGSPVYMSNPPMPPPNQMHMQGQMITQGRPPPPRPHRRISYSGPIPPPVAIPQPFPQQSGVYSAGPSPPGYMHQGQMPSPVMAMNPQALVGGGFPQSYQFVNGPAGMSRRRITSVSGVPGEPGLPTPPPTARSPTSFVSSISGALGNVDQRPPAPPTPSSSASPAPQVLVQQPPIPSYSNAHVRISSVPRESLPRLVTQQHVEMDAEPLKRSMSALSNDPGGDSEEARKKPRMDLEPDATPMEVVPTPPPQTPEQSLVQSSTPIQEQEQVMAEDVTQPQEDSGEESGDEIPLGPDGLRLVSDCLAELTSDGSDGVEKGICLLCSARFKRGLTTEEPTSLSGLSEDEAVQHFLEKHKAPWEKIRNDV